MPLFLSLLVLLFAGTGTARGITIKNESGESVYFRIYYCQQSRGTQAGKWIGLGKGSTTTCDRPPLKLFHDREVFISSDRGRLKDSLSEVEFKKMPHFNIGDTKGELFWIAKEGGQFKGFNAVEWAVFKPIQEKVGEVVDTVGKKVEEVKAAFQASLRQAWANHPYAKQTATVRIGTTLCPDEKLFRDTRMRKVRPSLARLLSREIAEKDVPVIAFAVTGGGYRAMVGCVGFVLGVKEAGLYDVATYFATLSGSTWALGPWFLDKSSMEEFRRRLIPRVRENLALPIPTKEELSAIAMKLIGKEVQGQPVTIVDWWGSLLARKLLDDFQLTAQTVGISAMKERAVRAEDPLPIFTAVANNISPDSTYEWFEFTPFEMGCDYLNAFVPVWSWGRTFAGGKSTDFAPEQGLSYGMGIFGSAFSLRIGDIIDHTFLANLGDNPAVRGLLDPILERCRREVEAIRKATLVPGGEIPNFAFGLPQTPAVARTKNLIKLSDAGHCTNHPLVPLLRKERKVDIIILFDFSSTMVEKGSHTRVGPPDLVMASEHCKKKGLPFPDGDWNKAGQENLTVFGDPANLDAPVILYIPRIKNPRLPRPFQDFDPERAIDEYASVVGTQYSQDQLMQWSDYVKLDLLELKPRILELIKARVQARQAAGAK